MKWYNNLKRCIEFKFFHIACGEGLSVRGKILLGWKVNLTLGNYVIINSGVKGNPNPIGNEMITSFTTSGEGKIIIGNHVGISNSCFLSHDSIIIEDEVMIGGGCMIFDTDFHPLSYQSRIKDDQGKTNSAPVRICKGAFIGTRSIIMKGVTIGERSVIGAGAVVTKSIPNDEVWGGNPARFIYKLTEDG